MRAAYIIIFLLTNLSLRFLWPAREGKKDGEKSECNIADFGAIGNGKYMNTIMIQEAIDEAYENGGGKVVIPKGVFLTGSIVLKSGVDLHVLRGGTLLGSTNPFDYKKIRSGPALVLADSCKNISITGSGTIDGQGLELALAIDSLYHIGRLNDIRYDYYRMRPSTAVRPKVIDISECSNIAISGVTIKNSSSWVEEYRRCENLRIDHVKVISVAYWNNDGMDICDCRNVSITNCFVNSADDGICLKTFSPKYPDDSISVSDCTIRSSGSAIKLGTDSRGDFENIRIKKIRVYDTFRSAIAIECVDGGRVNNIQVSDVIARNTGNAVFIRLGHRNMKAGAGTVKNVTIKNMKVSVPFGRPDINYDLRGPALPFFHNTFPSSITGIPHHDVENVTLSNIEITYPGRGTKGMAYAPLSRLHQVPEDTSGYPEFSMFGELPAWGFYVRHVEGLVMRDVH